MEENLISKKDLLLKTGISYGQLYRWKRKGLIPESWFVRRSTFTGQETFFPRDAMVERIRWIQGAKTDAALDDLAETLQNPDGDRERLPYDLVLSAAGLPLDPLGGSDISQTELFCVLAGFRASSVWPSPAEVVQLSLSQMPPTWLEYPELCLLGFKQGERWQCVVVQSLDMVWSPETPDLQLGLARLWSETKAVWETVGSRLRESGRGGPLK